MGSGSSGLYYATRGSSQPSQKFYSVVPEMLKKDKQDPDIYSSKNGYFKNPTAVDLLKSISGDDVCINDKSANGWYTYVVDKSGRIIFGKRCNPNDKNKRSPHPTLIGGKKPKVRCAGMINFRQGKIFAVNNDSGHYRPNRQSLKLVKRILNRLYKTNKELFDEDSKWRKNDQ